MEITHLAQQLTSCRLAEPLRGEHQRDVLPRDGQRL
jgi:hypothetical protein